MLLFDSLRLRAASCCRAAGGHGGRSRFMRCTTTPLSNVFYMTPPNWQHALHVLKTRVEEIYHVVCNDRIGPLGSDEPPATGYHVAQLRLSETCYGTTQLDVQTILNQQASCRVAAGWQLVLQVLHLRRKIGGDDLYPILQGLHPWHHCSQRCTPRTTCM